MIQDKRPYIIAHRGFHQSCPENTLSAFQAALDIGADGIELDVHFTKDNQAVVAHDSWISVPDPIRSGVSRKIRIKTLTFEDLQAVSARTMGEAIPALQVVLETFIDKFKWINVELKQQRYFMENIRLVEIGQGVLKEFPLESIILSSFHPYIVRAMKDWRSDLRTGFLFQPRTVVSPFWQTCLNYTRADFFHPRYDWYLANPTLHPALPPVSLWTLDEPHFYEDARLTPQRLFSIITNRPDLWLKHLSKE